MNIDDVTIIEQGDFEVGQLQAVREGLDEQSNITKNFGNIEPFAFAIVDFDGKFYGGLRGVSYYGCLYIDMLWVTSELRGQGFGVKLVKKAEEVAKLRQCNFITVQDFNNQALDFYLKQGYKLIFEQYGFYHNAKMNFLRKDLQ